MVIRLFEANVMRLMANGKAIEARRRLMDKVRSGSRPNRRHLNLLGICEAHLGNLALARQVFARVLAIWPRSPEAWNNLGNVALMESHPAEARRCYLMALRENVFRWEPYYNLTLAYQAMGQPEDALQACRDYAFSSRSHRWMKAGLLVLGISVVTALLLLR